MILTSKKGKEADIRSRVVSVDYYEDVLVPTYSMKIQIVDAGGSVKNGKEGQPLYTGLEIRGGERLTMRIDPNSSSNVALEFTKQPLTVRSVKNVMITAKEEIFTLHLTSGEAILNEAAFLRETYSADVKISDHVQNILTKELNKPKIDKIDPTKNKHGFQGNEMHPLEAIIKLSKKAMPEVVKGGSSAGYFFYQTKDGFAFRSIDALMKEKPKARYVYSEVSASEYDFIPSSDLPSIDRKIISYTIETNNDVIKKMKAGAFATDRKFFDPVNFKVTTPFEKFSGEDWLGKTKNLGKVFEDTDLKIAAGKKFVDLAFSPTKIFADVIDYGTIEKKVSKDLTSDVREYVSQSAMRYNTLFTQILSILVPLNSKLKAGDIIRCEFPKISTRNQCDVEQEQISGLYMIKSLCHHYDTEEIGRAHV